MPDAVPPRMDAFEAALAWDLPTRIFKWSLVLLIFDAWLSNKFGGSKPEWHKWNGYAILVLVVFRVLWGFWGGSTARFANFIYGPRAILDYLTANLKGLKRPYLGHNPVGALMVLALLTMVGIQGVLGLYSADDDRLIISGPLVATISDAMVDWASRWHHKIFDLLMTLVLIHVCAAFFYQFVKKDRLITAMVLGYKKPESFIDAPQTQSVASARAFVCLIVAIAIVFGGIYLAGGRNF